MATPLASPVPSQAQGFKSPLRAFRAEACERVGSEETYADAQACVSQWRKDLLHSASFEAQQGLRELSHEREHLKDLQADLAGVQVLVSAATQLQAGGARLAEVLHSSTEAAGTRAQTVAHVCDDLCELREKHRQDLEEEERNIAQRQEVADAQHAEAFKLLDTYKDRLGLAISRVAPQTVRMAFTLIDECDPAQEFFFTLGLGDLESAEHDTLPGKSSEGYHVRECVPQVPMLPQLLIELNANASTTTALPRFVCSMRRSFLKLSTAPKQL